MEMAITMKPTDLPAKKNASAILLAAEETLRIEANAILDQIELLGDSFENAITLIANSKGKVIVTGMGKSGIVGKKIAATLASTGTASFFLHPGEAYHGDLGMVSADDVILALSNSGETDEVLKILPFLKDNGNSIISISGNSGSTLAKNSDIHLVMNIKKEACPLSLAPTSSTTVTLALGDSLAVSLMRLKNFKPESFARFHPGGSLGKRLLTRAKDVMRTKNLPVIQLESNLMDVLLAITNSKMGIAVVMHNNRIQGVITDGDIRRVISRVGRDVFDFKAEQVMTKNPKFVFPESKIVDVEEQMITNKIHSMLVSDETRALMGIVELYSTTN